MSVQFINPFIFGGSGGGGPGPGAPATDYFAANGSSHPFYAKSTYPSAFYDSATQTTWKLWESFHDGARYVQVTTYNHSTGKWSAIYDVAPVGQVDDDHGVPAICMDHQGYVHCFYGPHNGDMLHSVTVAPNDPSAWRLQQSIAGAYTYPKPVLVGSTLYLFMRDSFRYGVRFKTTSLSGGVATFGAGQRFADFTDRFYSGDFHVVGTDIHFAAAYSDSSDSVRQHVYHLVYDTTDDSIHNSDASTDVAVGSQPISLATAAASFRVVDFGTDEGDIPALTIDGNGDLHIVYPRGSAHPFTLYHTIFDGSSWSAPASIGTIDGAASGFQPFLDSIALVPISGGDVDLYYPNNKASFTFGGDQKRRRYQSGAWGGEATILAAGPNALSHASAVRNGHPNARLFFTEIKQNSLDSNAGGLKMYGYGDGGFLTRQAQAPTDIKLSSTKVVAGVSAGTVIGQLHAVDTDYLDTFTWSIVSDPDGKFQISGNELQTADTISYPATHNVTIRATDSFSLTYSKAFAITVVQTVAELNDSFFSDIDLMMTDGLPDGGTDPNFADVELLLDGA
jgi:hypothetical protein